MAWTYLGNLKGPKGDPGTDATVAWDRGSLAAGTNLNTLTTPGVYRVDKGADVTTIVNGPADLNQPFSIRVTRLSTTNNIVVQRLTVWGATGVPVTYERQSLTGSFSGWAVRDWERGTLTAGTDLNTITEPGRYRADRGSDAASIVNRPAGATDPFTVEVTRLSSTNGIVVQRLTTWGAGGSPVTYERQSLLGVFGEWNGQRGESGIDPMAIAVFGDSLSENASGASWVEQANPLLTDTTLVNFARSGDDTNAVLIRAGVKRVKFKVAGGTIPASGSVALTTSAKLSQREMRAIVAGTIAGVSGTLTHTTGNAFTFTRTAAGTAAAATGWQDFTTGITTNAGIVLGWFGANDFIFDVKTQERSLADHIIAGYDAFVAWARATGRTPLIAGVTNQRTHLAGTNWFAQVQEVNRTLRQRYPGIFLDVQAYLVERAIYDAGLAPTAAELAGMARGEIPAQLYTDTVHLSNPARTALGKNWLAPWLAAQGYAYTTQTMPALPTLTPADETP